MRTKHSKTGEELYIEENVQNKVPRSSLRHERIENEYNKHKPNEKMTKQLHK
jgi:hypothetical protein